MAKGVLESPQVYEVVDGDGHTFRAEIVFDAPDAPHTLSRIDLTRDEGCAYNTVLINGNEQGVGITYAVEEGLSSVLAAALNADGLTVYEDIGSFTVFTT